MTGREPIAFRGQDLIAEIFERRNRKLAFNLSTRYEEAGFDEARGSTGAGECREQPDSNLARFVQEGDGRQPKDNGGALALQIPNGRLGGQQPFCSEIVVWPLTRHAGMSVTDPAEFRCARRIEKTSGHLPQPVNESRNTPEPTTAHYVKRSGIDARTPPRWPAIRGGVPDRS